jgi:hypothetical protein
MYTPRRCYWTEASASQHNRSRLKADKTITLLHLTAAREFSKQIQCAMAASKGTAAVIDGTAEASMPVELIDWMKPALDSTS